MLTSSLHHRTPLTPENAMAAPLAPLTAAAALRVGRGYRPRLLLLASLRPYSAPPAPGPPAVPAARRPLPPPPPPRRHARSLAASAATTVSYTQTE
jgi:hypothetical protein